MSVKTLIAKKQAAETVTRNLDKGRFPKTIQVDGNLAGDTIPLYTIGINGSDTTNAYIDGTALQLTATNTLLVIPYPCIVSIVKGVTANAVGLRLVEVG